LTSRLYNTLDPFPEEGGYHCFYTNPPWGASNEGESVKVFAQRGFEATGYSGEGVVVIADDPERAWAQRVLAATQQFALHSGFFVQKMQPRMHEYHLDDAPELRSCNLMFKALPDNAPPAPSAAIVDPQRLENFYGRDQAIRIKYIRERSRLDYGKAHDDEYEFELLGGSRLIRSCIQVPACFS